MSSVILVTGGTGLVGQAIKHVIETEPDFLAASLADVPLRRIPISKYLV